MTRETLIGHGLTQIIKILNKKMNHEVHPELNERTHLTGQAKKHEGKVVLGWVLVICQSLRDLVFQFVEIPICIYLRQSVS